MGYLSHDRAKSRVRGAMVDAIDSGEEPRQQVYLRTIAFLLDAADVWELENVFQELRDEYGETGEGGS